MISRRVLGLPDHGLNPLHDQQVPRPAEAGEVGADGLAAAELGRLAGQAERVGEYPVRDVVFAVLTDGLRPPR